MNTNRSLEQLEHKVWHTPPVGSSAEVMRCVDLRSKPLSEYNADDIRFMIGQNLGLKYLIPFAIQKISGNILLKARYYNGDLLKSILSTDSDFWENNATAYYKMVSLLTSKKAKLEGLPDDDLNIKYTLLKLSNAFMERSMEPSYS